MEKLEKLYYTLEQTDTKLEYSDAILSSINHDFGEIADISTSTNKEYILYEFKRVQSSTKILLTLLRELTSDSTKLTQEAMQILMNIQNAE